jgi:hypothetical protein
VYKTRTRLQDEKKTSQVAQRGFQKKQPQVMSLYLYARVFAFSMMLSKFYFQSNHELDNLAKMRQKLQEYSSALYEPEFTDHYLSSLHPDWNSLRYRSSVSKHLHNFCLQTGLLESCVNGLLSSGYLRKNASSLILSSEEQKQWSRELHNIYRQETAPLRGLPSMTVLQGVLDRLGAILYQLSVAIELAEDRSDQTDGLVARWKGFQDRLEETRVFWQILVDDISNRYLVPEVCQDSAYFSELYWFQIFHNCIWLTGYSILKELIQMISKKWYLRLRYFFLLIGFYLDYCTFFSFWYFFGIAIWAPTGCTWICALRGIRSVIR